MRKILTTILCVTVALMVQAQESISIKGKTIPGLEAQTEYWIFRDSEDTIVAINYSEILKITRELEDLRLQRVRLDSILIAKNELIGAFEAYEEKADTHIVTMDSLITYADSLYTGYKDLYHDLKSIADLKKFGLILGAGLNKYDQENPGYLFDLGFEYNKIQLSSQFGKKYNALTVRYRIPIF